MYDCRLCLYEDECDYINCRWAVEDDDWYRKKQESADRAPNEVETPIIPSNNRTDLDELLPMAEEIIQYLMVGCEHQGICEDCVFEYSQTGQCVSCTQSRNAVELIRGLLNKRKTLKDQTLDGMNGVTEQWQ